MVPRQWLLCHAAVPAASLGHLSPIVAPIVGVVAGPPCATPLYPQPLHLCAVCTTSSRIIDILPEQTIPAIASEG